MALLIDSSVFMTLERRGLTLGALATVAPDVPAALAAMTASELLVGVLRADTPERRQRREAFVEAVLSMVPVVAFDLRVARIHAQVWAQLMASGQTLGAHDLSIAATALAHGYTVLTDNLRDFRRVLGLRVLQPQW